VARPRRVVPIAALALVAVFIYAAPISQGDPVKATVELDDITPAPQRTVKMVVRVDPEDAADDARWFTATAWQGGGSVIDRLKEVAPGVYETTKPIPVYGQWKTTIRLHKGTAIQGAAVYFPEDPAIPAPAVQAPATFTRDFVLDKKLLQREQKPDVPGALTTFAYIVVLMIALGLLFSLTKGLRRLDRMSGEARVKPGTEVHETHVGAHARRFERANGDGDGDGAAAKEESGEKARSS
jgi:hypothetical protein